MYWVFRGIKKTNQKKCSRSLGPPVESGLVRQLVAARHCQVAVH
jgi:hypothetical protein